MMVGVHRRSYFRNNGLLAVPDEIGRILDPGGQTNQTIADDRQMPRFSGHSAMARFGGTRDQRLRATEADGMDNQI